jgi:hypothetical protein
MSRLEVQSNLASSQSLRVSATIRYTGLFRVTQSEIMANMQMASDSVPVFYMVHATKSMNLISLDC